MGQIDLIVAHCGAACASDCVASWGLPARLIDGHEGMMKAYQEGLRTSSNDLLAYFHDDVAATEPHANIWPRVLEVFEDESVGMVGFGGALRHGHPELYRKPYHLPDLARYNYMSNQEDAEVHGQRYEGEPREVAVIDGFALIIRRRILERAGGWPQNSPVGYIAYDQWAGFMAHRFGYRIMLVPVKCLHLGGQSSTKRVTPENEHADAHRYIYERFSDVLPWEVSYGCP